MFYKESEYTIERPGCAVHYWVSGNPEKPLLFFAHGAYVDHVQFDPQLCDVIEEHQIIRWDMRGHGDSKPLAGPFSVKDAADDALSILERIDRKESIFLGQSAGTHVIQELAFQHPDRVKAMVIIGGTCITSKLSVVESLSVRMSTIALTLWPYNNLKKAMVAASAIKADTRRYLTEAFDRLSKDEFATIWKGLASCIHYEPSYHVACPLLLVHGAYDNTWNIQKAMHKWAQRDPQSIYVVIPDAGHGANQDNASFFNRLMMAFLKGVR